MRERRRLNPGGVLFVRLRRKPHVPDLLAQTDSAQHIYTVELCRMDDSGRSLTQGSIMAHGTSLESPGRPWVQSHRARTHGRLATADRPLSSGHAMVSRLSRRNRRRCRTSHRSQTWMISCVPSQYHPLLSGWPLHSLRITAYIPARFLNGFGIRGSFSPRISLLVEDMRGIFTRLRSLAKENPLRQPLAKHGRLSEASE